MSDFKAGDIVRVLRGECSGTDAIVLEVFPHTVYLDIEGSGRRAYCSRYEVMLADKTLRGRR